MYTRRRKLAAWGVHAYTALGLPLAFVSTLALFDWNVGLFFLLNGIAVFVDATDGMLARKVKVREVLPDFDGRRLDDIVDFIIFAFLPSLALYVLQMLPPGFGYAAFVPLVSSGYGFCQERAKTDESFVGFPSYWNVGVFYMYVLESTAWANLVIILVFSLLVFVPIHYVYPTKTRLLRSVTLPFSFLWGATMLVLAVVPKAPWATSLAWASTAFPLYYFAVSAVNHLRIVRQVAGQATDGETT
jgi:phosphatidylcholine synthase